MNRRGDIGHEDLAVKAGDARLGDMDAVRRIAADAIDAALQFDLAARLAARFNGELWHNAFYLGLRPTIAAMGGTVTLKGMRKPATAATSTRNKRLVPASSR